MKKFLILLLLLQTNCSFNKVVQHHGVHNLEKKQVNLKINYTNKNDIIKLIGPPSTKSTFDNDVYIYIERKTSSSKLTRLGKKELITNNVLVLEVDNKGIELFVSADNLIAVKIIKIRTDNYKFDKKEFNDLNLSFSKSFFNDTFNLYVEHLASKHKLQKNYKELEDFFLQQKNIN